MPKPIETVAEFYAHAIAIEREAMERYAEFATYYAERGEDVLAGLCHNLASLEGEHLDQLLLACGGLQLPAIAAAGYQWLDCGPPEAAAREFFYRVANPRQLLELALEAENRAVAFFEWARRTSGDTEVRALAHEMVDEERQHVRWVRSALEYGAAPGAGRRQADDRGFP